ncbi:MAG: enoyl-CoA hydratase [Rhodospirillales bacterium CG15_BIG_FIL_POST_REV_8_21_14_020_66_15]|nr:MAG: enoyl-CoA hydratase [Rhodospirillales bacterium CG15_BIG_FIL_POST_REV_8_21_14_020_66_15]
MNTSAPFITEIAGGIATVTLRRPEIHNAFDDDLVMRLTRELQGLGRDTVVRVVILASTGKSFSAGADVNWMKRMAEFGQEENLEDAKALAGLMFTLHNLRKPTIAAVQGSAFGGGVGLVAACDIAVAAREAQFALTEVKLGILPAAVGPYVISAMGARQATRYMLTGERFDAARAVEIGLVTEVTDQDNVLPRAREFAEMLLDNGPRAMAEVKNLVRYVVGHERDEALMAQTAGHIARVRASDEGREGLAAFLERRKPNWVRK